MCRNGKKDDLGEFLSVERSEDASSEDDWLLPLLFLDNNHRLMDPIHHESHYICSWHSRQLLSDDVLKVDQVPHVL